jgi:hypothetical protein
LGLVTACDSSPCPDGQIVVDHECLSTQDATEQARRQGALEATRALGHDREREMDEAQRDMEIEVMTREAGRRADEQREAEEEYKDAVRSCILAGNNETLCELDPDDPYGTGNQP